MASPKVKGSGICDICLDTTNENMIHIRCIHRFHQSCLYKWINKSRTCPLCRCTIIPFAEWRKILNEMLVAPRVTNGLPLCVSTIMNMINFGQESNYDFNGDLTSPLMQAVWSLAPWQIIEALLNAGANPDETQFGFQHPGARKPRNQGLETYEPYKLPFIAWEREQANNKVKDKDDKDDKFETKKKTTMAVNLEELKQAIANQDLPKLLIAVEDFMGVSNINCKDPLHFAIDTGNLRVVQIVSEKWKPRPRWSLGPFPHLPYAQKLGFTHIVEFLTPIIQPL